MPTCSRPTTPQVCSDSGPSIDRSPLAANVCRKIEMIREDLAEIRPGWFHVGSKHDVPKDACYVGRSGDRYAWVSPDGIDGLTEFTLTVLEDRLPDQGDRDAHQPG